MTDKVGNKHILPFVPKRYLKNENPKKEKLPVSLWEDMEHREYPEQKVLISNLIHDRQPPGVPSGYDRSVHSRILLPLPLRFRSGAKTNDFMRSRKDDKMIGLQQAIEV